MNNLCKQYIQNAKALFPIMGKGEKEYLKKLKLNIEDYCEETSVSSIEELYKGFGTPTEVVNAYFSNASIDFIVKQVKRTKIIRISFIALITLALIAVSTYCSILYAEHQTFKEQLIFSEETFIE